MESDRHGTPSSLRSEPSKCSVKGCVSVRLMPQIQRVEKVTEKRITNAHLVTAVLTADFPPVEGFGKDSERL